MLLAAHACGVQASPRGCGAGHCRIAWRRGPWQSRGIGSCAAAPAPAPPLCRACLRCLVQRAPQPNILCVRWLGSTAHSPRFKPPSEAQELFSAEVRCLLKVVAVRRGSGNHRCAMAGHPRFYPARQLACKKQPNSLAPSTVCAESLPGAVSEHVCSRVTLPTGRAGAPCSIGPGQLLHVKARKQGWQRSRRRRCRARLPGARGRCWRRARWRARSTRASPRPRS